MEIDDDSLPLVSIYARIRGRESRLLIGRYDTESHNLVLSGAEGFLVGEIQNALSHWKSEAVRRGRIILDI